MRVAAILASVILWCSVLCGPVWAGEWSIFGGPNYETSHFGDLWSPIRTVASVPGL